MKIHRDRKEYACPHCPKRFNQRVAYNMHLRIHTGIYKLYSKLKNKCFYSDLHRFNQYNIVTKGNT